MYNSYYQIKILIKNNNVYNLLLLIHLFLFTNILNYYYYFILDYTCTVGCYSNARFHYER